MFKNHNKPKRRPSSAHPRLEPLEQRALLAGNLIANGHFEFGNIAFGTEYEYSPGNTFPEGVYDTLSNPKSSHPQAASYGDHTTGSGLMLAVNGALQPDQIVWSQIVNVVPNAPYLFSAWVSNWCPFPEAVAKLEFRFNNTVVGTFTASTQAGLWQKFTTGWYSVETNKLAITIVDLDLTLSGNDFALDDISLSRKVPKAPIPEDRNSFGATGTTETGVKLNRTDGGTPDRGFATDSAEPNARPDQPRGIAPAHSSEGDDAAIGELVFDGPTMLLLEVLNQNEDGSR